MAGSAGLNARHPELEAALLANRNDPRLWSLYGDWLEAQGDPRGQLVSLMLAREARPTQPLLNAQRELIRTHRQALLGSTFNDYLDEDNGKASVWRRGFLAEAHLDRVELLEEALTHPSTALLEGAWLVLPINQWPEWLALLEQHRPPWLRLRVQLVSGEDELPLAPLLACLPRLEALRVEGAWGTLVTLEGCQSPALRQLQLVSIGGLSGTLETEAFPALEALWVLESEHLDLEALRAGSCWPRLRVVAEHPEEEEEDVPPEDYRRCDPELLGDWESAGLAFVVVAAPVTEEQVRASLASVTGLERLVGRFATQRWGGRTVTCIALHGPPSTDLFPYALARALERELHGIPVACFGRSAKTGKVQWLVLGPDGLRLPDVVREDDALRTLVDGWLGLDPGPQALNDVAVSLASAAPVDLVGNRRDYEPLTPLNDVDPLLAPPGPTPEPFDDYEGDNGEAEERALEAQQVQERLEREPGELRAAAVADEAPPEEEPEEVDEAEEEEPQAPVFLEDAATAEREGPAATEEDPGIQDPLLFENLPEDFDALPAEEACAACDEQTQTRPCSRCGDRFCIACVTIQREQVCCKPCAEAGSSGRAEE